MTNGDCIRAMDNRALAFVIMCPKEIDNYDGDCVGVSCAECCERWLNQPVEDGGRKGND